MVAGRPFCGEHEVKRSFLYEISEVLWEFCSLEAVPRNEILGTVLNIGESKCHSFVGRVQIL